MSNIIEITEIIPEFEYIREVSKEFIIAFFSKNALLKNQYKGEYRQKYAWLFDKETQRWFFAYKNQRFFEILNHKQAPAGQVLKELQIALNTNLQDFRG